MTAEDPQHPPASIQDLNALTSGAFSANQSQERAALLKAWLQTQPSLTDLVKVHREMSGRDKGAAKVLKEAIDALKREHHQEELVSEWTHKAQQVLAQHPFAMGDALAWIRDAAKAGAPLSKDPLAGLKALLSDRIKSVEDLQQQCMVQREGVHLLMQRMDNLSAREWVHAQAGMAAVKEDVEQAVHALDQLVQHADWPHVDLRFPPQVEQARQLLWAAWQAFEAAGQMADAAAQDPQAPLPAVPAWAESIERLRHPAAEPSGATAAPAATPAPKAAPAAAKPEPTPEELAQRQAVHAERLALLEQAQALTRWVAQAAQAPTSEPEPEPADAPAAPVAPALPDAPPEPQAEASAPAPVPAPEAQAQPTAPAQDAQAQDAPQAPAVAPVATPSQSGHWEPALPLRQIQQQLRTLREAWKALDHQAPVHHGLWRKFDQACNRAYPFVKTWLGELKEQNQSHMAQREQLIEQVQAWTAQLGESPDWKQVQRDLNHFVEQWRHCGHLNEKAFGQILPRWKAALKAAEAPLQAATRDNIAERKRLIDEAKALSEQSPLPIDAIKDLQSRWQQVSQHLAIDRRLSQKLWEAFRQPIDEAFARNPKPARNAGGRAAPASRAPLSPHEQAIMAATQALEQAIAERDATKIQAARDALQASLRAAPEPTAQAKPAAAEPAAEPVAEPTAEPAPPAAKSPDKRLVAVRGDDRHKTERAASDGHRRDRPPGQGRPFGRERDGDARGPRLSDAVFGAQRHALEKADKAMRLLSAQAHGEQLRQLMHSWQARDAEQLPPAKALGKGLESAKWQAWKTALASPAKPVDTTPWIRLDIAAGLPTPASDQAQRRAYQLQLLTQRHAATPEQTWADEVTQVLASPHSEAGEKRLQDALKVLLARR